jgi:hypothetical protein
LRGTWGLISRMAEAARCQRSYLSRVLSSSIHLTPDHAYGLCSYWELSSEETEYFLTLVEHARSGNPEYRKHLETKLFSLRKAHEDLSNRVGRPRLELGKSESVYYSAWYWSAIHIITSIPQYQTSKGIAERLQLPEALVRTTLEGLTGFGFVERKNGKWYFLPSEIHVPRDSPLVSLHHGNWRQRAVLSAQVPSVDELHYTVVQSMTPAAADEIKRRMLDFIDEVNCIARPSKEEELVVVTCDLFKA